jgi:hypothetical protein
LAPSPLPEEIINKLEQTTPEKVEMNMGLSEKTAEVLKHLSTVKHDELTGASLEQYATT